MTVEYLEITDPLYIPECVAIQEDIFDLSDIDKYPASFFSLLIRKEHPLGIVMGCFSIEGERKKLIGLNVLIADNNANSVYSLYVGLIPEFRDGMYGYNFSMAAIKLAAQKGITTIYSIIDPLEANIMKLYLHMGAKFTKHIHNPYKLDDEEVSKRDKALFEWEIDPSFNPKETSNTVKLNFKDAINKYSIIEDVNCKEKSFLIEVPDRYMELMKTNEIEAYKWRLKIRELLSKYLNDRGYTITNCVTGKIDRQKKIYYLLSKEE